MEIEDVAGGGSAGDGSVRASARAVGLRLVRGGRALAAGALDLVYPPRCVGCGRATGVPHGLCPACWSGMRFIERPYCERLGTPFALDLGTGALLSPAAVADPPVFARARAVARYEGAARRLVHRLKYEDAPELATAMGGMMARAGAGLLAEADLVVPMPLHPWRLWRRRFNQAALLARVVARADPRPGALPCLHLLARVRATRPQVGLSRTQRGENLRGAFQVPAAARPALAGRRALLVDDVVTTGASVNAAARALLRGGARAVDVLTFARVVEDGA